MDLKQSKMQKDILDLKISFDSDCNFIVSSGYYPGTDEILKSFIDKYCSFVANSLLDETLSTLSTLFSK